MTDQIFIAADPRTEATSPEADVLTMDVQLFDEGPAAEIDPVCLEDLNDLVQEFIQKANRLGLRIDLEATIRTFE